MARFASGLTRPAALYRGLLKFNLLFVTSRAIQHRKRCAKRHARLAGASADFRKSFAKRSDLRRKSGAASSDSNAPSASCIPAQIFAGPSLALDCGYYDQSHFANEFRAFSGVDATTYFARRTLWANHIAAD